MIENGTSAPMRTWHTHEERNRRIVPGKAFAFILSTLLLITFAGCSKDEVPEPLPVGKNHTVMVYLPGTSLLRYYTQNIEGMCQSVSEEMLANNRIMIGYQPTGKTEMQIKEVYHDSKTGKIALKTMITYPDFNASAPEDVAKAFTYMQNRAPAQSYGVIIGCHGKAWVPAKNGTLFAPGKTDYDDYWKPEEGALPTRSFGDSNNELDITDLAAVLEGLETQPDYLIFDACFMANIETLYDLRNSTSYIVASPCEVMGIGFPYSQFTSILLSDADPATKMKLTCRNFYNYYNAQSGYYRSGCVSMAVTSELDKLTEVMRRINATEKEPCNPETLQIYEALSASLLYDFGHYVTSTCSDPGLLAEFETQMERAFPADCRLHTNSFYSAYNRQMNPITYYTGVSVSEPSEFYADANKQTNWYRATH